MSLRAALVVFGGALLAVVACVDEDDDGGHPTNTAECCPVSETASCTNFLLGGAKELRPGGACAPTQNADAPAGMHRLVDAKGCYYWESDPTLPSRCAEGDAATDAGTADAGGADAADATADADDAGS